MIRQPVVAGMFYPGSASSLSMQLDSFLREDVVKEDVLGVISPHAGYMYSGQVAGAAISRVALKDTFVIIGPNHTGLGEPFSVIVEGIWRTPLGDVVIDSVLAERILEASQNLQDDAIAHMEEHSIEVQLPFLQYLKPDIKIVPIVLARGSGVEYKEIGHAVAEAINSVGRGVVVMASSDMNHYEPQHIAEEKDNKAIEAILRLDEDELLQRVGEFRISMCGYGPTICLISACKELGATSAELVMHQTSGDVTGDYRSVVGYAGILVKGKE
jgi:AmmeMemoRadiSam system protein B